MKITTVPYDEGLKERLKNTEYALILVNQLSSENNILTQKLKRACEALKEESKTIIVDGFVGRALYLNQLADELERDPGEK